jgi:acyl-CoA thioesterase I
VINAGLPGETASGALRRLDRDVLAQDPRIVIVFLGGNDLMQRVPKATTLAAIEEIVRRIQETGALAVLVGLNAPYPLGGLNDDYEKIADAHGAVFVSNVMRGILDSPAMRSDQVHPNAAGYKLIADRIHKAVEPYL